MATPTGANLDREQLLRLLDLAARLNQAMAPEDLLQFIIATAADVLACDAASILLYEADADRLRFVAATGADPALLAEIPVPIEGSIAGAVFKDGLPVRTEAATEDERHYDRVDQEISFHTRSLLGVPMRIGNERVGVLEALNKRGGPFTVEDEVLLGLIADQAAVAIRNARQVEALHYMNARLERSEELRSRFHALATNELRTPLATIDRHAAALAKGGDAAETGRAITEATSTLGRVLNAISEVDRLHRGAGTLQLRPIPVERFLHEALTAIQPAVEAKRVRLQTYPVPDALSVRGDAERLERALLNVLENAVRYTPPGGLVTVRTSERGGGALIEIIDTGCGLQPEHVETIFREFFQADDSPMHQHDGLGLGLPIARGVVELHGGRLWARSEGPGRGATFALWLPGLGPLAAVPRPRSERFAA